MIILASTSARRREMMERFLSKDEYKAIAPGVDEKIEKDVCAAEKVKILSLRKAKAIADKCPDDIVIGSDTVVALGDEILEKPRGRDDAYRMLRALSGKTHSVYSGIAVVRSEKSVVDVVRTDVSFRCLTDDEIYTYIDTCSPYDKAGAYGIQEEAGLFVEKIDGDVNTVIGMPLTRLYLILRDDFGYDLLGGGKR